MSVRDELRNEATRLNIKGRSKMTKDELLAAIQDTPDNWVVINRHGDVSVQEPSSTDGIVDADDLVTVEFPEIVEDAHYGPKEIVTVTTTELDGETVAVVDDLSGVQERIISEVTSRPAQGSRAATLAQIEEEVAAGRAPFPYGLRGRGIGAKTYQLVSDRTLNRQIRKNLARLEGHKASAPAPLLNSERVQNYARSNVAETFQSHLTERPKLTHRQMRRVSKVRNKRGGDLYVMPNDVYPDDYLAGSFTKLARTPNGQATIHHQFAK